MIRFPTAISDVKPQGATLRAGGTDLQERRAHGISTGPLVDLRDLPGLDRVERLPDGRLQIGALVRIQALADALADVPGWRGLHQAAGGLATPEIRAVGTVGGNLLQKVRCWYYRQPGFDCLKKGGATCFARNGDHLYHACFDLGPCIAPHASTLGMALLAYDAQVEVQGAAGRTMAALLGDGRDPSREHTLEAGALLTGITVPAPWSGERSSYFRAISRARAEWPLVEVLVRLSGGEKLSQARVVIGGVATIPLRLQGVEQALLGTNGGPEQLEKAARLAIEGARPLPMTGYKLDMVVGSVLEGLERAMKGGV